MSRRAAGSADNAQNTHFFMLNNEGTFYLKPLPPQERYEFNEAKLLDMARQSKVKIGPRLNFDRKFPFYLDSNRFLSNLKDSSVFVPVVDMSAQYLNGLMYILTQEDGNRPLIVDDLNDFQPAGIPEKYYTGSRPFLNPQLAIRSLCWELSAPKLSRRCCCKTSCSHGLGRLDSCFLRGPILARSPCISNSRSGNYREPFRTRAAQRAHREAGLGFSL